MDPRTQNLIRAMTYARPTEIPLLVNFLPSMRIRYGDALRDVLADFPDIVGEGAAQPYDFAMPDSYRAGTFTDAWGCVWRNVHHGSESIVTGHPVATREQVRTLRAPSVDIGLPHGFLFLRLTDLRGFEEFMVDIAEEPPELQQLIDIVLAYDVDQLEKLLARHEGEIVYLGDDLGMQTALPMSPEKWRKYLKPCYARLFGMIRAAGKYVYMHTDGHILPILPDLLEAGAHMVNPQYRANGLEGLVRACKGRIPICLDLDRQLLPFATPAQLKAHVRECVEALYLPEGGLALSFEFADDVPLANVRAMLEAAREVKAAYRG